MSRVARPNGGAGDRGRPIVVAVAQSTTIPYDSESARARASADLEKGFRTGADVIVLPELIVPGYGLDPASLLAAAEPIDGPTVEDWADVAGRFGGLVVGGFAERDGDRVFNTAVAVSGDGVVAHYRKLHPFAAERQVFLPGDLGLPVVDTRWGRIGICVCYDLRFVETLRILSLRGAELVCVPTAWVAGFDAPGAAPAVPPQAVGAMVQANLDQIFVACASQSGCPADFNLVGGSLIADPWGNPRVGPLPQQDDGLAFASIDLDDVLAAQNRGAGINPREDRRGDVYAIDHDGERL